MKIGTGTGVPPVLVAITLFGGGYKILKVCSMIAENLSSPCHTYLHVKYLIQAETRSTGTATVPETRYRYRYWYR